MTEAHVRKSHDCIDAEGILRYLSARQHVLPHRTVRETTSELISRFDACPVAIARSIDWLNLDADIAIGRLRRTELIQLSNSIHRYWRAALDRAASA